MVAITGSGSVNNQGAFVYSWKNVGNGQIGNFVDVSAFSGAKLSAQIEGTFGVGGNVKIEGSNDGVNGETLSDVNGSALGTITAAAIKSIGQPVRFIRPNVSAGDGTTAINITLVAYPL